MAYSSITKPTEHFEAKAYTGNGTSGTKISLDFAPDMVWTKSRSLTEGHSVMDSVRGVTKHIITNGNNVEGTDSTRITSFDSDGYTMGTQATTNQNSATYVSWSWKGGGTVSSNTDGSITSNVSANTTAGFSIVSYTGTGANATVGHGLGVAPRMILIKNRADAANWGVYHAGIGSGAATDYVHLNTNGAAVDNDTFFNDTEPTSSVFSLGSANNTNDSSDAMIAYCFAEKKGFSKIGLYAGNNNADGAFVYTGFKPAWILFKPWNTADNWHIVDDKVNDENPMDTHVFANLTNGTTTSSTYSVDFLSNGFKHRNTNTALNKSFNYIYYAIAENPLVANVSGGLPATAR